MKDFRKIWDNQTNGFLITHSDLSRADCYHAFMEHFPDSRVTFTAFCNQLSRLGLRPHLQHGSTKCRPLYSEQIKKDYVRIKVAQPNVWISKAKWVYTETHPWEDCSESSMYIFLDGNNRNFDRDNIARVPRRICAIFNNMGGTKGGADIVRLRIAQAKLKVATLDAGEKLGLVVNIGERGRQFKDDVACKARESRHNQSDERREHHNKYAREYRAMLKAEGGERWERYLERTRRACREWQRRKRAEKHD